jgi:hypothetical protein
LWIGVIKLFIIIRDIVPKKARGLDPYKIFSAWSDIGEGDTKVTIIGEQAQALF